MNKFKRIDLFCIFILQIITFLAGCFLVGIDFYRYDILFYIQFILIGSNIIAICLASCSYTKDLDEYTLGTLVERYNGSVDTYKGIIDADMLLNHTNWFRTSILFWFGTLGIQALYMISYVWITKNFLLFFILEGINIALAKHEVAVLNKYKELESKIDMEEF